MRERDDVDDWLRTSAEVEVPGEVEARMRRQFGELRARLGRGRRRPVQEWVAAAFAHSPYRWAAAGAALATVLAIVVVWGGRDGGRVYAATVSRLAEARSVQYTMEIAPFVTVEFSHMAPAHERIRTSWGIEVRADGSGETLVLLHGSKQYVRERKGAEGVMRTADLIEQLRSLPRSPDAALGERTIDGKRLLGFRILGTRVPGAQGVESLDLWLDKSSGALDHVDITPAGARDTGYQMHIRAIQVDAGVDPALFDMAPPPGYTPASPTNATGQSTPAAQADLASLSPRIAETVQQSAIVMPMRGSYVQAAAAVARVAQHLEQRGIVPVGPAFGRFGSESHWDAGYPVAAGAATAESPFEVVTVSGGPVATLVVTGPWGQQSAARWSRLLDWVGEHGYVPAGPPTEVWSGDATNPQAQVTDMRIAVVKARQAR